MSLRAAFLRERGYDDLLSPYRERADRIMVGMNLFLLLVCAALAPVRDTWLAVLLVGVPTMTLAWWLMRSAGGTLLTRIFMACAFMAFTGLIIHQTGGDIEAHFTAFGLIGVLLYYRDWRTILAATIFIYLHHLVLGFAQTRGVAVYVFDTGAYWRTFAIHVAYFLPFVTMMGYLAVWLRREGHEAAHVIALANEIMRGDLTKRVEVGQGNLQMPLISAVVSMRDRLLDLMRVLPVPAAIVRMDNQQVVTVNRSWDDQCAAIPDRPTPFAQCPVWVEPETWPALIARVDGTPDRVLDKVEVVMKRRDGSSALCELSLILLDDAVPAMAIVTAEDITQRRQAELEMQRLAYRDALTDLPNRASLYRELQVQMDTGAHRCAVVMMDLDGFKPVNDRLGHDAGDAVLRIIAQRIQHTARDTDFSARLGGDEFVIVLRDCRSADEAEVVARRFIKAIARPLVLEGCAESLSIGASAGVVHCSAGAADIEQFLKQADVAMYRAKNAGRGCVVVYQAGPEPHDRIRADAGGV